MARLLLLAALSALADGRSAANCSAANGTDVVGDEAAFNGTAGNGTCVDDGGLTANDLGMLKVGVLTAVLVVVMISTCRLLFKMYAQFGMRDSPDGADKTFGE